MGLFDSILAPVGNILGDIGMTAWEMDFQSDEAHKNRNFQREMYAQRYQMTMDDLEAAGLNPVLAASLGGGTVPGGSAAGGINSGRSPVSSAMETARRSQEIKRLQQEVAESESRETLNKATLDLLGAQTKSASAQAYIDGLNAMRKAREARMVDEGLYGDFAAVFESMPPYLRGPLRAMTSAARGYSEGMNLLKGKAKSWLEDNRQVKALREDSWEKELEKRVRPDGRVEYVKKPKKDWQKGQNWPGGWKERFKNWYRNLVENSMR